MTNWEKIFSAVPIQLENFADGNLSARALTNAVAYSNVAGEVRQLLRNRGVTYARRLARKALRRRGY